MAFNGLPKKAYAIFETVGKSLKAVEVIH